jgi:hypothetical protein
MQRQKLLLLRTQQTLIDKCNASQLQLLNCHGGVEKLII